MGAVTERKVQVALGRLSLTVAPQASRAGPLGRALSTGAKQRARPRRPEPAMPCSV